MSYLCIRGNEMEVAALVVHLEADKVDCTSNWPLEDPMMDISWLMDRQMLADACLIEE
jgi:hypothetical protein